jgi:hypothetical protein
MKPLPTPAAFIVVAVASVLAAGVTGIAGAAISVYLYDRGTSKGNDLAVAVIGLHAFGSFALVVLFTLLWSKRSASWKIPAAAFATCICLLGLTTLLFSSAYDEYFAVFFFVAWITVPLSGVAAMTLCRLILRRRHTDLSPFNSDS